MWRGNLGIVAGAGFLAVMALAVAGGFASVAGQMSDQRSTYDVAPVCASPYDLTGCKYESQARVLSTSTGASPKVDVQFDQLGALYSGQLDGAYASQVASWHGDQVVDAEVWNGRLTKVGGLPTQDNPDTFAVSQDRTVAIVIAALFVPIAALFAWLVFLYRREMAYRGSVVAGQVPGLQPVPLRRETRAILARDAGHPRRVATWTMASAVCVAIVLTAAWVIYGVPPLLIAYVWVGCLGLGGTLAYAFTHESWQFTRDIADGVFIRATGPFSVRLVRMRAGTMTVVSVAGRKLAGNYSDSLESIISGTGVVDYLPHSGFLLAIRDQSGRAVWPPAEAAAPVEAVAVSS